MVEAGLLIHEGQLFFPQLGLHRVVDLGIWWQEQTALPLAARWKCVCAERSARTWAG